MCSYSLEEAERVVSRKFPAKVRDVEVFLRNLRYTLVHTPSIDILGGISIRDANDYPFLRLRLLPMLMCLFRAIKISNV